MPAGQETSTGAQGGAAEDQVLSEAMDVFNQTMGSPGRQGQESPGMPGDDSYGDSDILGQTAGNSMPGSQAGDETGAAADQGTAGMDDTQQAQACAGETGEQASACADAAGAGGNAGQQQAGTAQPGDAAGMGSAGSEEAAGTDGAAAGAMGPANAGTGGTAGQQQGADSGAGGPGGGAMGQDGAYANAGYSSAGAAGQGQAGSGGYGGSRDDGVAAGGGGAITNTERVGALDGQLNDRLAVFDGMILNKQQTVISEREENARASGHYGSGAEGDGQGSADGANGESAPLLTTMARGSSNSNAGGGMMPNQPEDNRKGDFGAAPGQQVNIPADIPNGSDDDVVARQLREAAMKETDPVLRDKLWDEYRKYKNGVALRK